MTKEKCEETLEHLARAIVDVYHEYQPEGTYITVTYTDGGLMFWTSVHDEASKRIDKYFDLNKEISNDTVSESE